MSKLTSDIIDRWKKYLENARANTVWVKDQEERWGRRRDFVRSQMFSLLNSYLNGRISNEDFRATFDRKTRSEWEAFGFKGLSGAMFLNKLIKYISDETMLNKQLRAALKMPLQPQAARDSLKTFLNFLQGFIDEGQISKGEIQPARTPFFLSAWWQQEPELWPIFYPSGRETLEREGLYNSIQDQVEDYLSFRQAFISLSAKLGLKSWEFEHLCVYLDQIKTKTSVVNEEKKEEKTKELNHIPDQDETAEDEKEEIISQHTQAQWLLAKIGHHFDCRVWIAQNDRTKSWEDESLGSLSIEKMPFLGLDDTSQRIIGMIDVLWLRGGNKIVAAFEIEQTTSIFSGLLRMADLAALSPNLNFPLYIVAPEKRLSKVKKELSRPTFQALDLHRRCAFFSSEDLVREADNIMQWANDPAAIDRLSSKIAETNTESGR